MAFSKKKDKVKRSFWSSSKNHHHYRLDNKIDTNTYKFIYIDKCLYILDKGDAIKTKSLLFKTIFQWIAINSHAIWQQTQIIKVY